MTLTFFILWGTKNLQLVKQELIYRLDNHAMLHKLNFCCLQWELPLANVLFLSNLW